MRIRVRRIFYYLSFLITILILKEYHDSSVHWTKKSVSLPPIIQDSTEVECKNSCEAIITLIPSDSYLLGALVLGYTLKKYGATINRDLYAVIPYGTMEDAYYMTMLKQVGWTIHRVKPIPFSGDVASQLRDSWIKLFAWNMTQYRIIAALDADTLLIGSIEEPFHQMRQNANTQLLAANDPYFSTTLDVATWKKKYFNSGVILLRPNSKTFLELIQYFSNQTHYDSDFPQQDLLNTYYRNQWDEMSIVYNLPEYSNPEDSLYKKYGKNSTRVLHFVDFTKPWNQIANSTDDAMLISEPVILWRRSIIEMIIDYGWIKQNFLHSSDCRGLWLDYHFQQLLNLTI